MVPGPVTDVVIEDERWRRIDLESLAPKACGAALRAADFNTGSKGIALLACNDRRITELNEQFRGIDRPTNVISWPAVKPGCEPACDDIQHLGDIAIAWETCLKEAGEFGCALNDHAAHLIVHGCLHLLGFRHDSDRNAARMETLEAEALALIGLKRPY